MNSMRAQAEPTTSGTADATEAAEAVEAGRAAASAVAAEVAGRLTDPDEVSALWEEDELFDFYPAFGAIPVAPAHSLTEGLAGTAVLFAEMGRQDPQARRQAHTHLSAAVQRMRPSLSGSGGLWGGLPSLAASAVITAGAPHHYRGMLATLDERILHWTRTLLIAEQARFDAGLPLSDAAVFDTVGGLAGVGRYLLGGYVLAGHDTHRDAVAEICRYLVRLIEPISVRRAALPGWYVLRGEERAADGLPPEVIGTGAAHGIAGPLSLLATARQAGITIPGHEEAISRIAEWLLRRLHKDQYGLYWNGKVSPEEELTGPLGTPPTDWVASWCWGTSGIARALQLAGQVLGRSEWQRIAVEAQRAVFDHSPVQFGLPNAGLCHGIGGLLACTVLIARDSRDTVLATHASELVQTVIAEFDPAHRFGYRYSCPPEQGTVVADRPGFITGAAGIALALREYAAADTAHIREPGALGWTSLLMLD
ncbi:MAG: lanthionine synthetase C family protein [Streptomycetaceae bacterium]|nr:lanthionine synthetase C family protein [Streptomycetaceae bacterium]